MLLNTSTAKKSRLLHLRIVRETSSRESPNRDWRVRAVGFLLPVQNMRTLNEIKFCSHVYSIIIFVMAELSLPQLEQQEQLPSDEEDDRPWYYYSRFSTWISATKPLAFVPELKKYEVQWTWTLRGCGWTIRCSNSNNRAAKAGSLADESSEMAYHENSRNRRRTSPPAGIVDHQSPQSTGEKHRVYSTKRVASDPTTARCKPYLKQTSFKRFFVATHS